MYYHTIVTIIVQRNKILGLEDGIYEWVMDKDKLKAMIIEFYSRIFIEE